MAPQAAEPVEVFFSYSHDDEGLRAELETHLAMLKNEGVIRGWHDRQITAGQDGSAPRSAGSNEPARDARAKGGARFAPPFACACGGRKV